MLTASSLFAAHGDTTIFDDLSFTLSGTRRATGLATCPRSRQAPT